MSVGRALIATVVAGIGVIGGAAPAAQANSSAGYWGAIALSPSTGHTGYAINYASQGGAVDEAEDACDESDCEAVVAFVRGCGAVAYADNGRYGWAVDYDRGHAKGKARDNTDGPNARVIRWACTAGSGR